MAGLVLVECAEEIGISGSILLDWACTYQTTGRPYMKEKCVQAFILEMLRDGDLKIVGINNQRPVLALTEQGKSTGDLLLQESAAKEFDPLSSSSGGY